MSRKDKNRFESNKYAAASEVEAAPIVEEVAETPVEENVSEAPMVEETPEVEETPIIEEETPVTEPEAAEAAVENQPVTAVEYDWDRPVEVGMFAEVMAANLPAEEEKEIVLKLAAKGLAFQTIINDKGRVDNESIIYYSLNPESTYKQYLTAKSFKTK